jgi:putative membrane protein
MLDPYCGPAPLPADIWLRWNFDLPLIGAILALWIVQARALRAERHGGARQIRLAGAWFIVLLLTISPLCAITSALFSARMAHHIVLMAIAAPLLVLALPERLRAARHSGLAVSALSVVHAVLVWLWHAPWPYSAALASPPVFWLMELSLTASAVLFWRAIASPRTPLGAAVMSLIFTVLHMGLLGALITFAPSPVYAPHLLTTAAWGLTALEDQQLAGLVLWVVGAVPYVAAGALLAGLRLMEESRGVR